MVGILLIMSLSQGAAAATDSRGPTTSAQDGAASNFIQRFELPGMEALRRSGEIAVESSIAAATLDLQVHDRRQGGSHPKCTILVLQADPDIDRGIVRRTGVVVDPQMIRRSNCKDDRADP
jgi:hypothetical protein